MEWFKHVLWMCDENTADHYQLLNRTKTMSRRHGLPIQIRSKFVRDFSGMCFFLIENIDMILTLIHKRKRKRKTGNKKEHIVPVFLFGSVRYDCFSKYFSLKNTSK
jgi:hypothetical protein